MKKQVGNALRTKNQIRNSKARGSQLEYDCQYSLQQYYKNCPVVRTSERGFQMQYDLKIEVGDDKYIAVECKRLKGISWNQLVKFYEKLDEKTPNAVDKFILFRSNRQPCLVFYYIMGLGYCIKEFREYFAGVEFQNHPSTRAKK